jgi:hypothetical protein
MKLMEHSLLTSNIDNKRNFPPFGLFTAGDKFGRRQGGASKFSMRDVLQRLEVVQKPEIWDLYKKNMLPKIQGE